MWVVKDHLSDRGHLSRDLEGGGVKDEEASKPRQRQV